MVTTIKLLELKEYEADVPPTVTVIPVEAKLLPVTAMVLPAICETGEKLATETACALVLFARNEDRSTRTKDM